MAREILFKAKRIDNGEWVEGLITRSISGFPSIMPTDGIVDVEVDINTLCQYTGLTDKNGNKIWENDVVNKVDANPLGWCRERKCKVSFDVQGYWLITTEYGDGYWIGEFDNEQLEVIGNIFEILNC